MKSVLLIGLGRFGQHVARKLNDLGHQVMAVDSSEEWPLGTTFKTPWRPPTC